MTTKLIAAALIAALAGCTPNTPPPCEYEDSTGPCYWDAQVRGNGEGRSFVIDENQEIHYLDEEGN